MRSRTLGSERDKYTYRERGREGEKRREGRGGGGGERRRGDGYEIITKNHTNLVIRYLLPEKYKKSVYI